MARAARSDGGARNLITLVGAVAGSHGFVLFE